MTDSTSLGFPSPTLSEPTNGPGGIEALAAALDAYLLRQRLTVANFATLPAAGDYDGHTIWVDDQNRHAVWNGSIWVMRTLSVSGSKTIVPVANTPTSGAIVFPAGLFYAAPSVNVSINSSVPGTVVTGCGVTAISASGATVWVTRTNTTSTDLLWTATLGN